MKREVPLFILVVLIVLLLGVLGVVNTLFSEKTDDQSFVVPQKIEETTYEEKPFVFIGGKKIRVDLADTPTTRTQGLSGRASLQEDEGMLFIFENSGAYGFWMKDMNFPIDIMWIDAEKNIVHIEKDVLPETYPNIFTPIQPALYVLEVQSGFSDKVGVKVGDKIEFSQNF